jgi:hypothetical protein
VIIGLCARFTFKNYALKSMDAVCAKLEQAILYIERNPALVRSITSFPYIIKSLRCRIGIRHRYRGPNVDFVPV